MVISEIWNVLFYIKGEKGDPGYEGIPGFQGVKVFNLDLSHWCFQSFGVFKKKILGFSSIIFFRE